MYISVLGQGLDPLQIFVLLLKAGELAGGQVGGSTDFDRSGYSLDNRF